MSASSKPSARYKVPLSIGFLVFAAFAAIAVLNAWQSHSRTTLWPATQARVATLLELCELQEMQDKNWVVREVADCEKAKLWLAERQPFAATRRSRQFTFADIEFELGGTIQKLRVRADILGRPAPAEGEVVTVHVDPDDRQQLVPPFGPSDVRAFFWTVFFGALTGAVTAGLGASIVFANARLGRERTKILLAYRPETDKPLPPIAAQVANGFGLALLGIGSVFALAALWAAIADGSWVGAQGAVIIFAASFGLWRICNWLATKVLS